MKCSFKFPHNLSILPIAAQLSSILSLALSGWASGEDPAPAAELTFAPAVATVAPSTVTVACLIPIEGQDKADWDSLTDDHRRIMRAKGAVIQVGAEVFRYIGHGSGFCVDAKGHFVTNNHVIDVPESDPTDRIQFAVCVGRRNVWHAAELVGRDPATDIAVIRAPDADAIPAKWGNSDNLQQGDIALAIGTPEDLDLRQTVTLGVISATSRSVGGLLYEDFIQTDASINSGNSGGPLINLRGEIIGVNQSIRLGEVTTGSGDAAKSGDGSALRSEGNIGLAFSVPSNLAKHVAGELIAHGRVRRGFLGVKLAATVARVGGVDAVGVKIEDVLPKTPAHNGGLQKGDTILAFDGHPVSSVQRFHLAVSLMPPESRVGLSLQRDGKTIERQVTLGDLGTTRYSAIGFDPTTQEPPELEGVELAVVEGPEDGEVVVVARVNAGCPAALAGLKAPSIIVAVGGVRVKSPTEFEQAASTTVQGEHLLLTVRQITKRSIGEPKEISIPITKSKNQ